MEVATWIGKRALVTGGVSGIGRAIAIELARRGAEVLATGLTEQELSRFRQEHPTIRAERLDVASGDDVLQFTEDVGRDGLDLLVNAAGTILRDGAEHDPSGFGRVIEVNLLGTQRMCCALREALVARRGSVVNLASMLSFFGSGFAPGYSASKGGVAQLTKSLAIAWAAAGVRVNAVAPGWIETPLTRPLVEDPDRSRRILERTPLGRWGRPEDVVGPVLFLASAAAEFITGVVLPVDGGYSVS